MGQDKVVKVLARSVATDMMEVIFTIESDDPNRLEEAKKIINTSFVTLRNMRDVLSEGGKEVDAR